MAEWITERIGQALKTSFAGIVGDSGATYWDTPGAVVVTDFFNDDEILDTTVAGPIYAIRGGLDTVTEATTQVCDGLAEFVVLCARAYTAPDTPFVPGSPSLRTIKNRMVHDIVRRLLEDVQVTSLAGLVENVIGEVLIVDRDQYYPSWALVEIRFAVRFHLQGLP